MQPDRFFPIAGLVVSSKYLEKVDGIDPEITATSLTEIFEKNKKVVSLPKLFVQSEQSLKHWAFIIMFVSALILQPLFTQARCATIMDFSHMELVLRGF